MDPICVIGVGKLGICLSLCLASHDYKIIGIDKCSQMIESIKNDSYRSCEPHVEELLNKYKDNLELTTDISVVCRSKLIFVVVPTPSLPDNSYDHSAINSIIEELITFGKQDVHRDLVICCTTMPGYCESVQDKLKDYNYNVSYNPEFIAQGNIIQGMYKPDIVLIGESSVDSGNILVDLYTKICKNTPVFCRMSLLEAEITKISINCFITTKIAFANMIGDTVIASGYNPDKVLNAIGSDSRIGNKYLNWGYGFGGPCFPRDNRALGKYLHDNGLYSDICEATDSANNKHLEEQIKQFKLSHYDISKDVVINSVSYKPASILIEESQQLKFAVRLAKDGYNVTIFERQCVIEAVKNKFGDIFKFIY
jgi:nucleotide sugar dehydrogenase